MFYKNWRLTENRVLIKKKVVADLDTLDDLTDTLISDYIFIVQSAYENLYVRTLTNKIRFPLRFHSIFSSN